MPLCLDEVASLHQAFQTPLLVPGSGCLVLLELVVLASAACDFAARQALGTPKADGKSVMWMTAHITTESCIIHPISAALDFMQNDS